MGRAYSDVRIEFISRQNTETRDHYVLQRTYAPDDEYATVEVLTPTGWTEYIPAIAMSGDAFEWYEEQGAKDALAVYRYGYSDAEDRSYVGFR